MNKMKTSSSAALLSSTCLILKYIGIDLWLSMSSNHDIAICITNPCSTPQTLDSLCNHGNHCGSALFISRARSNIGTERLYLLVQTTTTTTQLLRQFPTQWQHFINQNNAHDCILNAAEQRATHCLNLHCHQLGF